MKIARNLRRRLANTLKRAHDYLLRDELMCEHKNKMAHLGQLLASLAHETRNPVTAINARLYGLQKALPEGSPEHKDALVIRNEINRLDHIVKDYLKLTRPTDPRISPILVADLFQDLGDLLDADLSQQGVQLKIGSTTSTSFRGDPQQIKQVLITLIQNGADAISREGTIRLYARQSTTRLNGRITEAVMLEVEDTGHGIPPGVRGRLFDPFFSTKECGTGLGLAVAAQIVEKHGGAIKFKTKVNRGSTFTVVLPISRE